MFIRKGLKKPSGWIQVHYEDGPSVMFNDVRSFSGGRTPDDALLFRVGVRTADTYNSLELYWFAEQESLTVGTYNGRFRYIGGFYDENVDADVGMRWVKETTSTYISGAMPLLTEGVLTITSCKRVMARNPNSISTLAEAFYILDGHFEIKNIYYHYHYFRNTTGIPRPERNGYRNLNGTFHFEGWCKGEYVSGYRSERELNK